MLQVAMDQEALGLALEVQVVFSKVDFYQFNSVTLKI